MEITPTDNLVLMRTEGVTVRQGDKLVLQNINLDVRAGEILCVIGPNGAGKSTLIKTLLGLIPPTTGQLYRRANLRIGYLPQRLTLDPVLPLTVGRMMTLTITRTPAEVLTALEETGVGHLLNSPAQGLSGGEMQRVLLARALLRNPDLLMLDEPVQGVDFSGEMELYELIGAIQKRRGCGILMVSHDLHLVMGSTDRVVCLNRHICCIGTPAVVTRHPVFKRLFGERALAAYALYMHTHDHQHDLNGQIAPQKGSCVDATCLSISDS
ncbi:MAG: zinc ABC transporter ATP-binding protein ZnuC [Magnetococcus sp. DMHC-6]